MIFLSKTFYANYLVKPKTEYMLVVFFIRYIACILFVNITTN